jgi:hypothetical protein
MPTVEMFLPPAAVTLEKPMGGAERIEEYWDWVAVALFLLITVDLLTSLYAAEVVGLEHETNPLMVWLLDQSLALVVAVHIAVLLVAVGLFALLFGLIERSQHRSRRILEVLTEVYLGLLVATGLFVFANNLSVIVLGRNLL